MGTLVVINNDEGDHLQAIFWLSTAFSAPFWACFMAEHA